MEWREFFLLYETGKKIFKCLITCKDRGIVPDFFKFKVYYPTFETTVYIVLYVLCVNSNWEIKKLKKKIPVSYKKLEDGIHPLTSTVSNFDAKYLPDIIDRNISNKLGNVDLKHKRKLVKLGIHKNEIIYYTIKWQHKIRYIMKCGIITSTLSAVANSTFKKFKLYIENNHEPHSFLTSLTEMIALNSN